MTTMPHTPDTENDDLTPLLGEPFARAWAAPVTPATRDGLGQRLAGRLQASLEAERGMVTVRRRHQLGQAPIDGVLHRELYRAPASRALRPGEPRLASVVELAAGARITLPAGGVREFLVVQGSVEVDGEFLGERDFLLLPAGFAVHLSSTEGGQVFVREADGDLPERHLVRDAEAGWPEFAPGIRRRVLWAADGQASLLYQTDPGASVPVHRHGHDEECLMVEGELFLDDLLLQQGDYQLAPAGSGHRITETESGVILYAHGDLDLQFT
ncbi:MAG: hypothetical protein EKK53_06820 [Burkholderiales bacterium]|nr:MAG: hypothetical protein EKK53_06820 [Burkholderiales bacterium]